MKRFDAALILCSVLCSWSSAVACTDSDEGYQEARGVVEVDGRRYMDYCARDSRYVFEHACSQGSLFKARIPCPHGCFDGECVGEAQRGVAACYVDLEIEEEADGTSSKFSLQSVNGKAGDFFHQVDTFYESENPPFVIETKSSSGAVLGKYGASTSRVAILESFGPSGPSGKRLVLPEGTFTVTVPYSPDLAAAQITFQGKTTAFSLPKSSINCGRPCIRPRADLSETPHARLITLGALPLDRCCAGLAMCFTGEKQFTCEFSEQGECPIRRSDSSTSSSSSGYR